MAFKSLAIAAALAATVIPAKAVEFQPFPAELNGESVAHWCRFHPTTDARCVEPATKNYPLQKAAQIVTYITQCYGSGKPAPVTLERIVEVKELWSTVPLDDREAWMRGHDRNLAKTNPVDWKDGCKTMWFVVMDDKNPNSTPWRDYFTETIEEGAQPSPTGAHLCSAEGTTLFPYFNEEVRYAVGPNELETLRKVRGALLSGEFYWGLPDRWGAFRRRIGQLSINDGRG